MNTPYNTGKVQIGKYYQRPLNVEQDEDMIALQGWLIGDPKAARRMYWTNFTYVCVLVLVGCLMAFG